LSISSSYSKTEPVTYDRAIIGGKKVFGYPIKIDKEATK